MINSKMIYRIIGFLLLIETAMLLCCGAVSLFYKENDLQSFLISSAITTGVGILMLAIGKGAEKSLNRRDGYVIVSTAWIAFSLFGMLPYYIGGYIPSITDAFFETMSGFSSTGATILDDIEALPHGALQDVFKRDHAERTLASVHGGEGLPEVLARPVIHKIPEQIHSREIRVRTLGAEIGHGYGTLKGTGRSENFMPDGTQMLLGQGA